jgi:hypothetical protein
MAVHLDAECEVVARIMGGQDIERLSLAPPRWHIRYGIRPSCTHYQQYEQRRVDVLAAVLRAWAPLYLVFDWSTPIEDGLAGQWMRAGPITWLVPHHAVAQELYDWLYVGGWWLYARPKPLTPEERATPASSIGEFVRLVEQMGVALIVIAEQDNEVWDIVTTPALWPNDSIGGVEEL